ncbi:MAG: hypothetical protein ACREOM_04940 [Candidatus Dormibacteraceae bacterium]
MNDFDRLLQTELRRMLDPVVATPAPARKSKKKGIAFPAITLQLELVAGGIPAIEPAVVTVPIVPARLLS